VPISIICNCDLYFSVRLNFGNVNTFKNYTLYNEI
jgi:hypothetical protein